MFSFAHAMTLGFHIANLYGIAWPQSSSVRSGKTFLAAASSGLPGRATSSRWVPDRGLTLTEQLRVSHVTLFGRYATDTQ
jgi:hypothetical protein